MAKKDQKDQGEPEAQHLPSQQEQPAEQPHIEALGDGTRPEDVPDYPPSGRSPEQAAAEGGYYGGRVTGDPKPPEDPDPTMPAKELINPAGAPLLPHPGVSTSMPEAPTVPTDQQMDEFAPGDREAVEADREKGEEQTAKADEKAAPSRRKKAPDHAENANDLEIGQVINGPRQ